MRSSHPSGNPPVQLTFKVIDLLATALHRILPWILAVWLLASLRATILAVAGPDDLGSVWLQLLSGANRTRGFAFVFGMMGMIYGFRQRDLRHAAVNRLALQIRNLEQRLEASAGPGKESK